MSGWGGGGGAVWQAARGASRQSPRSSGATSLTACECSPSEVAGWASARRLACAGGEFQAALPLILPPQRGYLGLVEIVNCAAELAGDQNGTIRPPCRQPRRA